MSDALPYIEVFVAVSEERSFTTAADRLGVSKATVSKHIATLEQHLGTRLFRRTTRSIRLTAAGEQFYQRCYSIINEVAAAEAEVRRLAEQPVRRLRVGAPTALGDRFVATMLASFREHHPQLQIHLMLFDKCVDLHREDLDVEICSARNDEVLANSKRIGPVARILCAPAHYGEQRTAPVNARDLLEHTYMESRDFGDGGNLYLAGPNGSQPITVHLRVCANNSVALRAMVLAGIGVALLPSLLIDEDLEMGRLLDVLPNYRDTSYSIFAVFPDDAPSPEILAFVEHLEQHLARVSSRDHDSVNEGLDCAVAVGESATGATMSSPAFVNG